MKKNELEDFLLKGNLNLLPATFLDAKDSQVISKVSSVMRYWPDEELYPSLLLSLLRFPKQFKKIRSFYHLGRLISAEFFYKKKVEEAVDQFPQKRHLFIKLLPTNLQFPFGSKAVLGILTTFNLMKQREAFDELHILEAVRRIVPAIKAVQGSFFDYADRHREVQAVYLEIEKENFGNFSLEEIKCLQKNLPDEFKGCIQQLVPVTFMRRNEEEVYRNILALRDQLKTIRDIPQTTISFEEQTQFDLFFTVVVLRVIKGAEPTISQLFEQIHPETSFILDRVDMVGTLRGNYKKEATVFRLKLPKTPFYRKDRSVNLYKARRKIVSMLIKVLGPIRDFNGGLILKQNERLDDFLAIMPPVYDEFLLENFFYSITPIAMQSILPPQLVKEWFLLFSELIKKKMSPSEMYRISWRNLDEAVLIAIRSEDRSFEEELLKEIHRLQIPSLELAFSETIMGGHFCLGFLYRPSSHTKDKNFSSLIRDTMKKWAEKFGKEQAIRIALQGGEPCFDLNVTTIDQSHALIKMLFEGLTRINCKGEVELAVAESFEVSEDKKKYTFRLRDCYWTNGKAVTASDFAFSWKQALHPQSPSCFSRLFYPLKNARIAKEGKIPLDAIGVCAVDEKTLVVELEYPAPFFLEVAAHWTYSLINRQHHSPYPQWCVGYDITSICNGPFKIVECKQSKTLILEKNPLYWDSETVKLQNISLHMIERQNGTAMTEGRGFDFVGKSLALSSKVFKEGEFESVKCPLQGVSLLYFNTQQFPFNHKKIRQAFAYAIDRSSFSECLLNEFGDDSHSLLPRKLSLHSNSLFPYSLEMARDFFKQGLGEIGFVKSDFPLLVISYCGGREKGRFFKQLCQQWQEVFQINVQLKPFEGQTHFHSLMEGEYQMGAGELLASWNDPLHLLEIFYDQNEPANIANWQNAQFRNLLKSAMQAKSVEERNMYLRKAERLLCEEVPAIPLYELSGVYFKNRNLKGFYSSAFSEIDFKWAYRV